jgi:hypothetical protein
MDSSNPSKPRMWHSVFLCIVLYLAGFTGAILLAFYLMGELEDPAYLFYFAPVPGLLFYGVYYVITQKLDSFFESRPEEGSPGNA